MAKSERRPSERVLRVILERSLEREASATTISREDRGIVVRLEAVAG